LPKKPVAPKIAAPAPQPKKLTSSEKTSGDDWEEF